jgi:hypothetical protein
VLIRAELTLVSPPLVPTLALACKIETPPAPFGSPSHAGELVFSDGGAQSRALERGRGPVDVWVMAVATTDSSTARSASTQVLWLRQVLAVLGVRAREEMGTAELEAC